MQYDNIRNRLISIKYKPMSGFLTPFIKKILEYLFITVTDGDIVLAKDNTSTVDDTYFVFLDDIGTMHAYEA